MNKKIFENARFCPKGDIEANWNKAVGFVPLDKEIIIYKKDDTHPAARFKVGDGVTAVQDLPFSGTDIEAIQQLIDEKGELLIENVDNAVAAISQADWNQLDETAKDYIKNKPFYDSSVVIPSKTYMFDGILEGKEYTELGNGIYLIKISDDTPSKEQLINGTITVVINNEEKSMAIPEEGIIENPFGEGTLAVGEFIFIISKAGASIPNSGIGTHFIFPPGRYVSKLITSEVATDELKQLDEKFIPDSIARIKDLDSVIQQIQKTATKANILSIFN